MGSPLNIWDSHGVTPQYLGLPWGHPSIFGTPMGSPLNIWDSHGVTPQYFFKIVTDYGSRWQEVYKLYSTILMNIRSEIFS